LGDIQDFGQVMGAVAAADAIVHLAGIPTHGVVANELTFAINTGGTFNVHEAAWRLGVSRVVTMSSEAVLGWAPGAWTNLILPEYLPLDEEHPTRPQDSDLLPLSALAFG
jgi:nucleoside-diphosphate-sugar epimerase